MLQLHSFAHTDLEECIDVTELTLELLDEVEESKSEEQEWERRSFRCFSPELSHFRES